MVEPEDAPDRGLAGRSHLEGLDGVEGLGELGEFDARGVGGLDDPGDPDRVDDSDAHAREVRRWKDHQLLLSLAENNFEGAEYKLFASTLGAYGVTVVQSWLLHGRMWPYCAQQGRPVRPGEAEHRHLSDPVSREARDDREELALETTGRALCSFREHVLVPGAWSFEGGASLKTYFAGACKREFPNVYSVWETEWRRRAFGIIEASDMSQARHDTPDASLDPALTVLAEITVEAELADLPIPVQEAVALRYLFDASHAEIAAAMGVTERAVEGMLYRYRQSARGRSTHRRIL